MYIGQTVLYYIIYTAIFCQCLEITPSPPLIEDSPNLQAHGACQQTFES